MSQDYYIKCLEWLSKIPIEGQFFKQQNCIEDKVSLVSSSESGFSSNYSTMSVKSFTSNDEMEKWTDFILAEKQSKITMFICLGTTMTVKQAFDTTVGFEKAKARMYGQGYEVPSCVLSNEAQNRIIDTKEWVSKVNLIYQNLLSSTTYYPPPSKEAITTFCKAVNNLFDVVI